MFINFLTDVLWCCMEREKIAQLYVSNFTELWVKTRSHNSCVILILLPIQTALLWHWARQHPGSSRPTWRWHNLAYCWHFFLFGHFWFIFSFLLAWSSSAIPLWPLASARHFHPRTVTNWIFSLYSNSLIQHFEEPLILLTNTLCWKMCELLKFQK